MTWSSAFRYGALVLLAAAAAAVNGNGRPALRNASPVLPFVGYYAPSAVSADLRRTGQNLIVGPHPGHGVILNFFASWCPPCQAEAPSLEQFYRNLPARVLLIGVDMGNEDSQLAAEEFLRRYGLTFPVARDAGGQAAAAFDVASIPTTIGIDTGGRIVARIQGPLNPYEEARLISAVTAGNAGNAGQAPAQAGGKG